MTSNEFNACLNDISGACRWNACSPSYNQHKPVVCTEHAQRVELLLCAAVTQHSGKELGLKAAEHRAASLHTQT